MCKMYVYPFIDLAVHMPTVVSQLKASAVRLTLLTDIYCKAEQPEESSPSRKDGFV